MLLFLRFVFFAENGGFLLETELEAAGPDLRAVVDCAGQVFRNRQRLMTDPH